VHLGDAGQEQRLLTYFEMLAARLRHVRISCGDWLRVLGPSVTEHHGLTAIFLDPPYREEEHSFGYVAGGRIWESCRAWAFEHGNNPLLRIALCGYEDGQPIPEGWQVLR
jgi:DNA adenine methylase